MHATAGEQNVLGSAMAEDKVEDDKAVDLVLDPGTCPSIIPTSSTDPKPTPRRGGAVA